MAEGIRNKVAIVGMGCTKFGEHWDRSAESLVLEAFEEAMEDAGIEKKDIDAAWLSMAAEKPCRHLDLFLMSPETIVRSFLASTGDADVAVI